MEEFPFLYERIAPMTWACASSVLMLALFFKFNRFWSVRNFDLLLIILLVPGLLMVEGGRKWVRDFENPPPAQQHSPEDGVDSNLPEVSRAAAGNEATGIAPRSDDSGSQIGLSITESSTNTIGHDWQRFGYGWLFVVGAVFLIRMLIDPNLVRRPILDPNLSIGGLVFLGCSLMLFLFANIATSEPTPDDLQGAKNAVKLIQREAAQPGDIEQLRRRGPGYTIFNLFPIIPSFENSHEIMSIDADDSNMSRYVIAAKSLAIVSQILIVLGLILFCYWNYDNFNVGVGTATIYLLLPYTAIFTGHVMHVLPAALVLWALVSFRRPWIAGLLIGFATGVAYYPIFLLPLWASFYWERGVRRFISGVLIAIGVCVAGLMFTSVDMVDFGQQLRAMFGFWEPLMDGLQGIWALGWSRWWRLPLLVAFVLLCVSFVTWPTKKNIGTLVAYSAAIMVAVQFWHGFYGGLYMAWYLPMVLLCFFRPNLSGRVAISELQEKKKRHKETAEDLLPTA